MLWQIISFLGFTLAVGAFGYYQLRKSNLNNSDGYFLAGRSLTGVIIAGSLLLTNISSEHLIGMNGSAYKHGAIIITWEISSAIALVIAALYFAPRYLKMGLRTIPQFLEERFDASIRMYIAMMLIISFVCTILPIVLYTGAINIESLFNLSEILSTSKQSSIVISVLFIGVIGGIYAIFGGLKMVATTDAINGLGLLLLGSAIPVIACLDIGEGDLIKGISTVFSHAPEKFDILSNEVSIGAGARESILPASALFTGLIINQLYFWAMHQSIIQRVLGAVSLKEAQKGLLITGGLKLFIPFVVVFPGLIAYYYFGEQFYDNPDIVYPELVKLVLPSWMKGLFMAVLFGAILSTFNSVLNSAATVFSFDIYSKHFNKNASDSDLVKTGKNLSILLAVFSICVAPFVASAPQGLYQLLQQLNGIFFIPMASVILAGFLFKDISPLGAKIGLLFGLTFYVFIYFVLQLDIHFVHVWGIEFVLNILVMIIVSRIQKYKGVFKLVDRHLIDTEEWKHKYVVGISLILVTLLLYLMFGYVA